METRPSNKECWLVYLFGTLVSFVIMRCGFSPSSMSMHLRPEYDLNIYYLIGQGWMQGRLPYVEFADLKGPLVFLLHGLGSLLTPGSFLGAACWKRHWWGLACCLLTAPYAYFCPLRLLSVCSGCIVFRFCIFPCIREKLPGYCSRYLCSGWHAGLLRRKDCRLVCNGCWDLRWPLFCW